MEPTINAPRPVAIAPALHGMPRQQDASPMPSMPFTRVTCARRKVKCDKTGPPCSTCRKTRLDCFYEAPAPRKRKRKPVEDVHERLEQCEQLLRQHGLLDQIEKATPKDDSPKVATTPDNTTLFLDKHGDAATHMLGLKTGKLVARRGKSRYIDSNLWRNLQDEELAQSSEEEEEDVNGDGTTGTVVANRSSDPLSASLFSAASPGQSLLDLHPTYNAAMKLWKIYRSHVEPITKLLHVPTVTAVVQRAAANPSSASKATECLLFVIYHFACVAMSSKECEELMEQPQSNLQARYHSAAVQALVNASFLRTTDLLVVQSYVLFLLSVRNKYDPHTFWILTGVGVRLGQRIGLHRDPEELGLNPFDVQMRRRLFWQLLPLDGIAAQMSGTGIAIPYDTWDTKQPLNLNDEDIWPDMTEKPEERVGATDMLFCMMRTEMGKFHQKVKPFLGSWGRLWEVGDMRAIDEMDKAIEELEETMESKYLRYLDPVYDLHLLALLLGRGAPQNARLRLRLPRVRLNPDASEEERRTAWKMCLKMFDYDKSAHTNPTLQKFSWHMQAVFQWDCVIWVLNEIRRGSPAIMDPGEAWIRIEWMFECHPQFMQEGRAVHAAIRKLALKAWDGQPQRFRPADNQDPAFIQKLRAICVKRQSSINDAVAPVKANPWSPNGGVAENAEPMDPTTVMNANFDLGTTAGAGFIDDFSPDNIDWEFWDQLIQDSGSLPPAIGLPAMDFKSQH